jgi:hypothetical protein
MKNSNQNTQGANAHSVNNEAAARNGEQTSEVLYQKLGNKWFAFSLIDNEVFVGSLSEDELNLCDDQAEIETFKVVGNS